MSVERDDIFERARVDGLRRLTRPRPVHLVAAVAAGGALALAFLGEATVVAGVADVAGPGVAALLGALVFAAALPLVVSARLELFGENVYGPATAMAGPDSHPLAAAVGAARRSCHEHPRCVGTGVRLRGGGCAAA
jgi:formate/nitrite transporter FocA (FNT family)